MNQNRQFQQLCNWCLENYNKTDLSFSNLTVVQKKNYLPNRTELFTIAMNLIIKPIQVTVKEVKVVNNIYNICSYTTLLSFWKT